MSLYDTTPLFDSSPVEFKITFTTACSMKCDTCLQSAIKNHYHLDVKLFNSIINQITELDIPQKKKVSFYSIGESYLYPDFASLCEWAIPILHKYNIETCIVTNGTHIDRIPTDIDEFFISFNAGTKASFEKITGYSFDNVYNNIIRLYNEGEFKKAKKVQIHMLCFDENKGEEKDFKTLFRNLKGVGYRLGYKYDNQMNNTSHAGRDVQYINDRRRIPCSYVTQSVVIYSNGDVVRCSHDFFDEYSYGNLNDTSLHDILCSARRKDVYEDHLNCVFRDICETCDFNTVSLGSDYVSGMFVPYENIPYQIYMGLKRIHKALKV